jgi:hypothetical protein
MRRKKNVRTVDGRVNNYLPSLPVRVMWMGIACSADGVAGTFVPWWCGMARGRGSMQRGGDLLTVVARCPKEVAWCGQEGRRAAWHGMVTWGHSKLRAVAVALQWVERGSAWCSR